MDLCPIQDAFRFRARYLGLKTADLLIDETGELDREQLSEINHALSQGIFPLGPGREGDAAIFRHLAAALKELTENPEIWTWLRKFSPPLVHKKAEEIIR